MNLLSGIMIDIIKNNSQNRNIRNIQQEYGITFVPCVQTVLYEMPEDTVELVVTTTWLDSLMIGRTYQILVMVVTFATIMGLLATHDIKQLHQIESIVLNIISVTLYTVHFFLIIFVKVAPIF
jgi:hypothetical protein